MERKLKTHMSKRRPKKLEPKVKHHMRKQLHLYFPS